MHTSQKSGTRTRRSRYRFSHPAPARQPISVQNFPEHHTGNNGHQLLESGPSDLHVPPSINDGTSIVLLSPRNAIEQPQMPPGQITIPECESITVDLDFAENNTQLHLSEEESDFEPRDIHSAIQTCETSNDFSSSGPEAEQPPPIGDHGLKLSNWKALAGILLTTGTNKLTKNQYQSLRTLVEFIGVLGHSPWNRTGEGIRNDGGKDLRQSTTMTRINVLPHFSTIQKQIRPLLVQYLAPRIQTILENVDTTKAGARPGHFETAGPPCSRVTIILTSEYARADAATAPVWSQMVSTSLAAHHTNSEISAKPSIATSTCIDVWPLVADRNWFYGPQAALHLETEQSAPLPGSKVSSFAENGDTIKVVLDNMGGEFPEKFDRCFGATSDCGGYRAIQGAIVHSWTVHHVDRRCDPQFQNDFAPNLSERDQNLSVIFNYVSYVSPSDCVPIDESERLARPSDQRADFEKARRSDAMRKKRKVEEAWQSWEKPLLKPGDFVVMLRPCSYDSRCPDGRGTFPSHTMLTADDQACRLFVVNRFWIENGERARHIFWVTGATGLQETTNNNACDFVYPLAHSETTTRGLYDANRLWTYSAPVSTTPAHKKMIDVRSVVLISMHSEVRGYLKTTPTSSVGTLSTGEKYFVYRFLLFWDGFEVQSGKSASGEGIYLLPLNLPLSARSSANAVRVLGLTPPGVDGAPVLRRILEDILVGVTTGFIDYDADGTKRRIFLDLVGLVGDTPALNQYLDVLGHNASAFCHLCSCIRGSTTLLGSRYGNCESHGMLSQKMRGFFQHCAVRDCKPQEQTCRLLGMKPTVTSNSKVFQEYCTSLFKARNHIPRTSAGAPVVPHVFDPYRASFIAPDHLLTGHFRDCVSLVLKLLPTKAHLVSCENFMMAYLREAKLPVQTRLIDHDKRTLYQMSMTEVYSLSAVAHAAFEAGCKLLTDASSTECALPEKCREAISLVRSCSELISSLWWFPVDASDGFSAVNSFQQDNGMHYLREIQRSATGHLEKIRKICCMRDADAMLADTSCPKQQRLHLSKIQSSTLTEIKCIDKPNVHRLFELVFTTLPMVGHIGRIGELVLEKTHQRLKRAIQLSNNKDIQFHCVLNTAVSDWRGRLTLLAKDAFSGSKTALLGCYRLLAGREALIALHGEPKVEHYNTIHQALGPGGCLVKELLRQGHSVLSPRAHIGETTLKWFISAREIDSASTPANLRPNVANYLRVAFHGDLENYHIQTGDQVFSKQGDSILGRSFVRGNVIEVLCYEPGKPSCHFPFLVQVNCMPAVQAWKNRSGPALWCIIQFVSMALKQGPHSSTCVYAAVFPCKQIAGDTNFPYRHPVLRTAQVDLESKISFLKLEQSVRFCGLLHECPGIQCDTIPPTTSSSACASLSPLQGCKFLPLTRLRGYPPRKG